MNDDQIETVARIFDHFRDEMLTSDDRPGDALERAAKESGLLDDYFVMNTGGGCMVLYGIANGVGFTINDEMAGALLLPRPMTPDDFAEWSSDDGSMLDYHRSAGGDRAVLVWD